MKALVRCGEEMEWRVGEDVKIMNGGPGKVWGGDGKEGMRRCEEKECKTW